MPTVVGDVLLFGMHTLVVKIIREKLIMNNVYMTPLETATTLVGARNKHGPRLIDIHRR